jgi:hypothetical protein
MKFQQLLKRLKATVRKNNRKDIMKKKYDIEKIKKEGYTKLNSLNDLKDLFTSLNANIETGDGFTSYTLDSKNFKVTEFILSQLEIKGKKQ